MDLHLKTVVTYLSRSFFLRFLLLMTWIILFDIFCPLPVFSCLYGFNVNIFLTVILEKKNPCQPSPCGPNSICRIMNEQAVCSCLIGYLGVPPSCRPECLIDSDCTSQRACSNQKCNDPCVGACGINAECMVRNHKAICYCRNSFTGDPFTRCTLIQSKLINITSCYMYISFIIANLYLFS